MAPLGERRGVGLRTRLVLLFGLFLQLYEFGRITSLIYACVLAGSLKD